MQFEPYNTLRQMTDIPDEVVKETLASCIKNKLTLNSAEFMQSAETEVGRTETCYLSLKHRQPDITREEIRGWSFNDCMAVTDLAVSLSAAVYTPDETQKKIQTYKEKFPHLFLKSTPS